MIADRRTACIAAGLFALSACAGDDVFDDIENQAWDALAAKVSAYCGTTAGTGDLWLQRTRIEARREIRQRGTGGPPPPADHPVGLDARTAAGHGPVMMIWCAGETEGQGQAYAVPVEVWRGMVRDWRD